MRIRIIFLLLCMTLAVVLQATVFEYIKLFNMKPNIVLVIVVVIALSKYSKDALFLAFFGNFLQDVLTGKIIGFYTLIGLYVAILLVQIKKGLYKENFFIVLFLTFVATIVYETAVYFFNIFNRDKFNILYAFNNIVLPESIYNCLISVIIIYLIRRFYTLISDYSSSNRRY